MAIPRTLYRYLATDMVVPFFAWLVGLLVMLIGNFLFLLLKVAEGRPLPWDVIIRYLVFRVPSALVMAVPMAFLFAAAITLSRFGKDGELVGMRMAGMGPRGILAPIWITGFLLFAASLAVFNMLAPWATRIANDSVRNVFMQQEELKAASGMVISSPDNRVFFYADGATPTGDALLDVVICRHFDTRYPEFMVAERAEIKGQVWELTNCSLYEFNELGFLSRSGTADVGTIDREDILNEAIGARRELEEYSIAELRERVAEKQDKGAAAFPEINEIHTKIAIPFACVAFGLIIGPLTVRPGRGGSFTGLLLAAATLSAYYLLFAWGKILGQSGGMDPVLAAWLPSVVFVPVGMVLIWRSR